MSVKMTSMFVKFRRAIAVRERKIHSMKASKLDDHHFMLSLATQAGTYVKEFAHGDFGRTTPNLGKLLGVESDILELDVEVDFILTSLKMIENRHCEI